MGVPPGVAPGLTVGGKNVGVQGALPPGAPLPPHDAVPGGLKGNWASAWGVKVPCSPGYALLPLTQNKTGSQISTHLRSQNPLHSFTSCLDNPLNTPVLGKISTCHIALHPSDESGIPTSSDYYAANSSY